MVNAGHMRKEAETLNLERGTLNLELPVTQVRSRFEVQSSRFDVSRYSLHKPIPNPAHGIQIFCRRTELLAQTAHVRVHRARVHQAVVFPNVAQQMSSGE